MWKLQKDTLELATNEETYRLTESTYKNWTEDKHATNILNTLVKVCECSTFWSKLVWLNSFLFIIIIIIICYYKATLDFFSSALVSFFFDIGVMKYVITVNESGSVIHANGLCSYEMTIA